MGRKQIVVASLLLLLVVSGCTIGSWTAVQPVTDRFVMPGALDVEVSELGFGRRVITYHMGDSKDGWLSRLARRLTDEGWQPPNDLYRWGSTESYANIYTNRSQFWRLTVWEQARLDGDSRHAHITVRRWVEWR